MSRSDLNILQQSVLVVAHPDDEALWFSSILADVGQVVICFKDVPRYPVWTAGRAASLSDYPLNQMVHLDITEAGAFWGADWKSPVETEFGLALDELPAARPRYEANYRDLTGKLDRLLSSAANVITHNPWGEYGHVEHVQVHRAVRSLQQKHDFNLWVSSYFSNKSATLLSETANALSGEFVELPTDRALAQRLADLYKTNECWTWFDDYRWPESEAFFLIADSDTTSAQLGSDLPMHLTYVDPSVPEYSQPSRWRKIRCRFRRIKNRLTGKRAGDDAQA